MFLRHFIIDYFYGLKASFQGFFVVHKLDAVLAEEKTKGSGVQNKDDAKTVAPTVLRQRRERSAGAPSKTNMAGLLPEKPNALRRIFHCVLMNVACVVALQFVILPLIRLLAYISPYRLPESWSVEVVSITLGTISILPVFIVTRIVNALWFSDIANASLMYRGIKPADPLPFSRAAADFLVAILVEVVFLVQSMVMVYLPIPTVAPFITFFHLSLLHALYSFEYSWMSQGLELKNRLTRIERCWPYFMGFGTPLTVLSTLSNNFLVNGCLFGTFFPFFIVSSYLADTEVIYEESSSIPTVHIFWPSLIVTNRISLYISKVTAISSDRRRSVVVPSKRHSASVHLPSSRGHQSRHSRTLIE